MECEAVYGIVCIYSDYKVYHEWLTLLEAESENTPKKLEQAT